MKLLTKLGRRGTASELPAADDLPQPRSNGRTTARAEAARANPNWTELDSVDLVKRGRFLVSADTDKTFTPYVGLVWHRDHDRIEYGYDSPLHFTVEDGNVRLLERYSQTWSQIIRAQAGAR